jgi:hypothetical protein
MAQSVTLVANLSLILKYENFVYTMNASVCLLQICRGNQDVTKQVTNCIPVFCC